MQVTWTVLRMSSPSALSPWKPVGASWWQAGHSSPGNAQAPVPDGCWWSVVATWDAARPAPEGPPGRNGTDVWHVVLEPASSHGAVVLAEGARPFDALPPGEQVEGPAALITVAGRSPDDGREREFFRRFMHVSRDIARAPGHVMSLVHAPASDPEAGPVLTFSIWEDLTSGLDWAYSRSRPHTSAVARQRAHGLVQTSGSVRCAVRSSRGTLGDLGDPLAAVLGRAVATSTPACTP